MEQTVKTLSKNISPFHRNAKNLKMQYTLYTVQKCGKNASTVAGQNNGNNKKF